MRKVTSLDVAAKAGVSQSAVSRVFSGASASKTTVEKVRAAALELGYRPNVLARSLITGKSRIIGLIVAYLDNPFYPDVLERLSNALQAEGYHILVFMASGEGVESDRMVQDLLDYQVDGIIAASVGMSTELAARCQAAGIPLVLFNRGAEAAGVAEVTSDNLKGAAQVARFLAAGGHRAIAHVSGWQGSQTGRARAQGFRDGLAEAGVEMLGVRDGFYDRDKAATAALELADLGADALFVGNDHMAFSVMDALRGRGAKIGTEISVVGYDDVPMAAWPSYGLTTVRQPVRQMVEATVGQMLRLIEAPETPTEAMRIAGRLMVRGSARVPQDWPSQDRA